MLETISWKEYGLLVGGAVGLYYGWWVVKYAASLGWRVPRLGSPEGDQRLRRLYQLDRQDGRAEAPNGVATGNSGSNVAGAGSDPEPGDGRGQEGSGDGKDRPHPA
jgi:hypothetical protein